MTHMLVDVRSVSGMLGLSSLCWCGSAGGVTVELSVCLSVNHFYSSSLFLFLLLCSALREQKHFWFSSLVHDGPWCSFLLLLSSVFPSFFFWTSALWLAFSCRSDAKWLACAAHDIIIGHLCSVAAWRNSTGWAACHSASRAQGRSQCDTADGAASPDKLPSIKSDMNKKGSRWTSGWC